MTALSSMPTWLCAAISAKIPSREAGISHSFVLVGNASAKRRRWDHVMSINRHPEFVWKLLAQWEPARQR